MPPREPHFGTVTPARVDPEGARAPARWSSRVDQAAGISEEMSFFGGSPGKLFGSLHTPIGEPIGGLVICCPYQAELQRNYRREVLLARHLAAKRIAVQRFHYRGSGHSDGAVADVTFETMREDAVTAAEHLGRSTGVSDIAFLGTRWGGLVAAGAASAVGGHLALWEPVVEAARYFSEILRFRLAYDLKENPSTTLSESDLVQELNGKGSVDVLGHTLERRLCESAAGLTMADVVGPRTSSALLVQISIGKSLRKEYAGLAASCRRRGLSVETHTVRDREPWWISSDLWRIHEIHQPTQVLIALTSDWVVRRLSAREAT